MIHGLGNPSGPIIFLPTHSFGRPMNYGPTFVKMYLQVTPMNNGRFMRFFQAYAILGGLSIRCFKGTLDTCEEVEVVIHTSSSGKFASWNMSSRVTFA